MADDLKEFANDVEKTYKQALKLNEKLNKATPELETAIDLLSTYFNFLEKLDSITGKNSNISLAGTIAVDMEKVGKNLVTGFVKGIKSEYSGLSKSIKTLFSMNRGAPRKGLFASLHRFLKICLSQKRKVLVTGTLVT